jgi:hypothetical protein
VRFNTSSNRNNKLIVRVLSSEQTSATLVGFLLTTYLVLRGIYTPMLHDEIATFFYFIQPNDFLPPHAHWDANNHVLNSFLGNLSYQMFGDAPWALRLPNMICYPIYLYFSWHTLSQIDSRLIRWTVFLALISSTYVFEYFALCRGYGMSLGLLIWSLYLLFKATIYHKAKGYFTATFMMFLAVSANLTLIYIYLMLLGVSFIKIASHRKNSKVKKLIVLLAYLFVSTILLLPLLYFSFELKSRGALYYGGNSFLEFTIKPLLNLVFESNNLLIIVLLFTIFFALVLFSAIAFIKSFGTHLIVKHLFTLLLFGSISAILLSHFLLGVNYPEDRTAMYLVPLFLLSIAFTLNEIQIKHNYLMALPLLVIPVKFIRDIDVKHALFAMEERHIQEYFDYIDVVSKNQDFKPTVGGYATQSFCWYYMNYRCSGEHNAMLYSSHPDTICDYQILNDALTLDELFFEKYTKLNSKPKNNQNLYKRNHSLQKKQILHSDSITNWNHQSNEFFNLTEIEIQHTWKDAAFLIEIEGIIHAPNKPFYATLTVSQKNEHWHEISQERTFLSWIRNDWSDDKRKFTQTLVLPKIDSEAQHIQVFLWNIKKEPYLIKDCKVTVYLLY